MKTLPLEVAIERPLGPIEEVYWHLDNSSPMLVMGVSKLSGGLTEEHLRAGLDEVQRRHPMLRVKIVEESGGKGWFRSRVPALPLTELPADLDLHAWLEEELLIKIPSETGPLVACYYQRLERNTIRIAVKMHHAISDGTSVKNFLVDWVKAATQMAQTGVTELTPLPQLPYFNERFPAFAHGITGFFRWLYVLFRLLGSMLTNGAPRFVNVDQSVPVGLRGLYILEKNFPESIMTPLLQRARQEGTTVHGALYAAVMLAVAKEIDQQQRPFIASVSSVNIREKMQPAAKEDIGYLVTAVISAHKVNCADALWPLAREIKQRANEGMARGMEYVLVPWTYRFHVWRARKVGHRNHAKMAEFLEKIHQPLSLVVTNMGQLNIEQHYGPYRIEDMVFYGNPSVLSPFVTIISTLGNVMTWTLQGCSPVVTRQQLIDIFDNAQNYLLNSINAPLADVSKEVETAQ